MKLKVQESHIPISVRACCDSNKLSFAGHADGEPQELHQQASPGAVVGP